MDINPDNSLAPSLGLENSIDAPSLIKSLCPPLSNDINLFDPVST